MHLHLVLILAELLVGLLLYASQTDWVELLTDDAQSLVGLVGTSEGTAQELRAHANVADTFAMLVERDGYLDAPRFSTSVGAELERSRFGRLVTEGQPHDTLIRGWLAASMATAVVPAAFTPDDRLGYTLRLRQCSDSMNEAARFIESNR
jgi:hypothetical protein